MTIEQQVQKFINNPYPLWENETTDAVVKFKWKQLLSEGIRKDLYNTPTVFNKAVSIVTKTEDFLFLGSDIIYIEYPSAELFDFYLSNGLQLYTEEEIEENNAVSKIKDAINLLNLIPGMYDCISRLVRSVQILKSEDPEIDISYTHPDIPFTIFVSTCYDNSPVATLRLAEAILHETMHLKLTLIENLCDLIKPDCNSTFYSPWRDAARPIKGVLHGLFVFKAIAEFLNLVSHVKTFDLKARQHLQYRLDDIITEFEYLANFEESEGFTEDGANLVKNLLPSN